LVDGVLQAFLVRFDDVDAAGFVEAFTGIAYARDGGDDIGVVEFARHTHGGGEVVGAEDVAVDAGDGEDFVDVVHGVDMFDLCDNDGFVFQPFHVAVEIRAVFVRAGEADAARAARRVVGGVHQFLGFFGGFDHGADEADGAGVEHALDQVFIVGGQANHGGGAAVVDGAD